MKNDSMKCRKALLSALEQYSVYMGLNPYMEHFGICIGIRRYLEPTDQDNCLSLVRGLFAQWPKWSGLHSYPIAVGSHEHTAKDQYDNVVAAATSPMNCIRYPYVIEYIALRKELLCYMISILSDEVYDDGR